MSKRSVAWLCLIVSGLTEIGWAYYMKVSDGFTILLPTLLALAILIFGFVILNPPLQVFGIGMTYAIFTGIGIVGTTLVGILLLHEGISTGKLLSLAVLLGGLVGLKFCDGHGKDGGAV